ncbi:MAG: SAM-dependent chlorinase/fluorinase [Candidatus Korarchaeum sp.]
MVTLYLLTDFGYQDYYVGAVKGVIRSICPRVEVVDLSHGVRRFDVKHGAFILWQSLKWLERDSIVLGVVDPGVGTSRDPIIIRSGHITFVGPDNGLFWPAVQSIGSYDVYKIDLRGTGLAERRTGTFDGRDVFAPVAAMLACGRSVDEIAFEKKTMEALDLWRVRVEGKRIYGEVRNIDRFGNIVTNIPWSYVNFERALVRVGSSYGKARTSAHYGYRGLLIMRGSSDLVEVSVARGSAADLLDAEVNDDISLEVIE